MHLTRLLTAFGLLVTFVAAAPTPASAAPVSFPYVNLDKSLPDYGEFEDCTPEQQLFLQTTMDDVHKLAALAFYAAQVGLRYDDNKPTFQLFGRNGTLSTETIDKLLTTWFGIDASPDGEGMFGDNVELQSKDAVKKLELIASFYAKVEDTLFNVTNRSLQYNCKPPEGTCAAKPGLEVFQMPLNVTFVPQADKPSYQVQFVNLCPRFWDSPSLGQTLQRTDPISGVDPMPAAYLVLAQLMRSTVYERVTDLLDAFGRCWNDEDDVDELLPISDRFIRAQGAVKLCSLGALIAPDNCPAFALEVAEFTYR